MIRYSFVIGKREVSVERFLLLRYVLFPAQLPEYRLNDFLRRTGAAANGGVIILPFFNTALY